MYTETITDHWAVTYATEAGQHGVYARGNMALLHDSAPAVAIVGARACTAYGAQVAAGIAAELTEAGQHVVTDGGYGIGAAATRAVLAAGGRPIVWAAGGLDTAYPSGHAELFGQVIDAGGLLVSLVPDGERPTRDRFAARADAIGVLADLTVVVEAGARSGALNVAGAALREGRLVAAVPGPITSVASAGANALLRDARVRAVTDVTEVSDWL